MQRAKIDAFLVQLADEFDQERENIFPAKVRPLRQLRQREARQWIVEYTGRALVLHDVECAHLEGRDA
ncbi:hypothetical protein D3C78_1438480 [compost metagenome]